MNYNLHTYRKLGDFITQRREKNNGYDVPIRGVSKEGFIDPKQKDADTSIYNVFYKNDFVFNPARMELNSIALNRDLEKGICSSLYEIFYINETDVLDPIYLNMLLKRDHFIRFCAFKGWGSVREYFRVNEICEYMIPVPPIEEQRRIVSEYQTVERRIQNNELLIKKLEETAQAIYHHTFVEGIDENNLPEGWRKGCLGDICEFAYGKMPDENKIVDNGYPVYCGYAVTKYYSEYSYDRPTIVVIARGDAGSGEIHISPDKFFLSNLGIAVVPHDYDYNNFLLFHLQSLDTYSLRTGSAQAQVTINSLSPFGIMIPSLKVCKEYNRNIYIIQNYQKKLMSENEHLRSLQSLLTSKLS